MPIINQRAEVKLSHNEFIKRLYDLPRLKQQQNEKKRIETLIKMNEHYLPQLSKKAYDNLINRLYYHPIKNKRVEKKESKEKLYTASDIHNITTRLYSYKDKYAMHKAELNKKYFHKNKSYFMTEDEIKKQIERLSKNRRLEENKRVYDKYIAPLNLNVFRKLQ